MKEHQLVLHIEDDEDDVISEYLLKDCDIITMEDSLVGATCMFAETHPCPEGFAIHAIFEEENANYFEFEVTISDVVEL